MNRPLTVYFDTSFYIELADAPQRDAEKVICELNDLRIRHVISGQVILELLSNASKPEKDKNLVSRIMRFEIEPLRISSSNLDSPIGSEELSWEVLLLKGKERKALASLFKSIFDLQTHAESWSKLAREDRTEDDPKLQKSLEAFLTTMGFESIEVFQSGEGANKLLDLSNEIFKLLSEIPNAPHIPSHPIERPDVMDSASLLNLSNEILNRLGSEVIGRLEEKDRIVDSTTASDGRPYKVVVNEASAGETRRLGNTLRDSNSMSLFVAHQDEIDLLQVDAAQMAMIANQRKPVHKLVELGLHIRCFLINSFVNTAEVVRLKMNGLGL